MTDETTRYNGLMSVQARILILCGIANNEPMGALNVHGEQIHLNSLHMTGWHETSDQFWVGNQTEAELLARLKLEADIAGTLQCILMTMDASNDDLPLPDDASNDDLPLREEAAREAEEGLAKDAKLLKRVSAVMHSALPPAEAEIGWLGETHAGKYPLVEGLLNILLTKKALIKAVIDAFDELTKGERISRENIIKAAATRLGIQKSFTDLIEASPDRPGENEALSLRQLAGELNREVLKQFEKFEYLEQYDIHLIIEKWFEQARIFSYDQEN